MSDIVVVCLKFDKIKLKDRSYKFEDVYYLMMDGWCSI